MNQINSRKILFLSLCFLCTFSLNAQKVIDKIVAQVGDNVILLSDIEGQKASFKQSGKAATAEDECAIIENLMYQFLLVNQAELDSIVISDEQVDAEMENRLRMIENQMKDAKDDKGNPITIESFYGKSRSAIKEEFRVIIKKRLQGDEVERDITRNTEVSPREVEVFFKSIPKDSLPLINSQLGFQQIAVFPTITKLDKQRAKDELQDALTLVRLKKATVEKTAKSISDDPGSATQGGMIEATRGMMVPAFEAMAYSLKPGEISEVFETEFGFHFMQLIERKGDDYVVRHVLKTPKFSLDSLDAADKKINQCYNELKANSITWEQAVLKYSNDVNTKGNKGYITNPFTGEQKWSIEDVNKVDSQMFQMTDALGKNQFSSPNLYTDFMERKEGLRMVRLAERTEPHIANLTDDYDLFRRLAEEDKKNKAILAWTKSRISTAYIRIDDQYKNCVFQNVWIAKL